MAKKRLSVWAGLTALAVTGAAWAENLIVVELYTSQGCSSCPPADALFGELSQEEDILALGFHVDVWDYLGWKDEFANPNFAVRQRDYNASLRSGYSVVTPQMIFQGASQLAGTKRTGTEATIAQLRKAAPIDAISFSTKGASSTVTFSPSKGTKPADIYFVTYQPEATVKIRRGENAGRTITYHNIVTGWKKVGKWNGTSKKSMSFKLPNGQNAAVILQEVDYGPIIAASRLN